MKTNNTIRTATIHTKKASHSSVKSTDIKQARLKYKKYKQGICMVFSNISYFPGKPHSLSPFPDSCLSHPTENLPFLCPPLLQLLLMILGFLIIYTPSLSTNRDQKQFTSISSILSTQQSGKVA